MLHSKVDFFYQGVSVAITVWDYDADNLFVPFDLVDEFYIDYYDYPGKDITRQSATGFRKTSPSE